MLIGATSGVIQTENRIPMVTVDKKARANQLEEKRNFSTLILGYIYF